MSMSSSPDQQPIEPGEFRDEQQTETRDVMNGFPPEAHEAAPPEAATQDPAFPLNESAEPQVSSDHLNLPADLRVPWTTRDVILFALFYLLSPFIVALPLFIAAAVSRHGDMNAVMNDKQFQATLSIIAQAAAALLTLGYLWVLVKVKNAGQF